MYFIQLQLRHNNWKSVGKLCFHTHSDSMPLYSLVDLWVALSLFMWSRSKTSGLDSPQVAHLPP